jgi:hypothetical protein
LITNWNFVGVPSLPKKLYKFFAGAFFMSKAGVGYIEWFQRSFRLTPDE